jgi:peroxiredoxin
MKKTFVLAIISLFCLMNSMVNGQLPATNFDISPLLIGEAIPDVMITDSKGVSQSVVALTKEKPTLIFFYRGKWCGNCITHFSEEIAPIATDIANLGYNIIAISPDVPDTLVKTAELVKLDPKVFYSDGEGALSTGMGVAVQQAERSLARLSSYSGGKNKGYLPVPSLFIVGTDQKIIFEYINPNGPQSDLRIRGKFLMIILQGLKN